MMRPAAALLLAAGFLIPGCAKESSYLGVTGSEWRVLAASDDPDLRAAGLSGLVHLAAEDPGAVSHLTALLAETPAPPGGDDPVVAAVVTVGVPALESLDPIFKEGTPAAQARARQVLLLMGDAALPYLVHAVENMEDVPRCTAALEVLAGLGSRGGPAVPALIKALQDDRAEVASKAMLVLGRMGPAAYEGIPYLLAALGHPEAWGRAAAVDALAHLCVTVNGVEEVLHTASRDEKEEVAAGAADALALAETLRHAPNHPDTLDAPAPSGP